MYLLIGSCRLYQPFLDFFDKKNYLINPLGVVSGAPEMLQSLNYILDKQSIDLNSFSDNEIKRFFKKTTNRGRLSKLLFGPEVDLSRPENISNYMYLVLEISSFKYVALTNHGGQEFYTYMPAEGAINAGAPIAHSKLSIEDFRNQLAQISELIDPYNLQIIVSVPHNLHNILKREVLRDEVIKWAQDKKYVVLDYNEIAKSDFNGEEADIFPQREIESGRYIRHTKNFYRVVSERIEKIVKENLLDKF